MSLIILGANGMLGSMLTYYVSKHKPEIAAISLGKEGFNCLEDDVEKLGSYINSSKQVTIVNCIGAIPQKKFTTEEFILINSVFPHKLASFCKEHKVALIHISTNCVFSGQYDNQSESDRPDSTEIYGISKKDGEPEYGLVIRCSIIGPELHSYAGLMEWFLHTDQSQINGYTYSMWNGLTTLELSKIIIELIGTDFTGNALLHYYSSKTVSKCTLLTYISTVFNKNIYINAVDNGLKYYTLTSGLTDARKSIYDQLVELKSIINDYYRFHQSK